MITSDTCHASARRSSSCLVKDAEMLTKNGAAPSTRKSGMLPAMAQGSWIQGHPRRSKNDAQSGGELAAEAHLRGDDL